MEINLDEKKVGTLFYKRFKGAVYEYTNNQKTDTVSGFKLECESSLQRETFTVKVLNPSPELIKEIESKDINFFNQVIKFENLTLYTYMMNGKNQVGYRATSIKSLGGANNGK